MEGFGFEAVNCPGDVMVDILYCSRLETTEVCGIETIEGLLATKGVPNVVGWKRVSGSICLGMEDFDLGRILLT